MTLVGSVIFMSLSVQDRSTCQQNFHCDPAFNIIVTLIMKSLCQWLDEGSLTVRCVHFQCVTAAVDRAKVSSR